MTGRWRRVLTRAFWAYYADGGPRMAAALAYYAAFSLAPLVIIAVGVAGVIFPRDFAAAQIVGSITSLLGPAAGIALREMVYSAIAEPTSGLMATLVGVATLFYGASGVLAELRRALNTIWRIGSPAFTWTTLLHERLLSFGMVLGIGFLLMVSLVVSTVLNAFGEWLTRDQLNNVATFAAINTATSLFLAAALFAAILKRIPDRSMAWRDVWLGAIVTAVLFTAGKSALGWYLGRAATTSAYGAAGSFVALLVWVYYSAQIVLYGAEVTRAAMTETSEAAAPSR